MSPFVGAVNEVPMGSKKTPTLKISLDWKSYFYRFVEVHGEPVACRGVLLFRDGWQYSSTDYQGPEFPPPKDATELSSLKREYWEIMQAKLRSEFDRVDKEISKLREWEMLRNQPLQQRVTYESRNDAGAITLMKSQGEQLDLSPLVARRDGLQRLLKECEEHLLPF